MPRTTCTLHVLLVLLALAGCSATKKHADTSIPDSLAVVGNATESPQGTLNPQPTGPGNDERVTARPTAPPRAAGGRYAAPSRLALAPGRLVPRGTPIHLRVAEKVSTEYSARGSHWSGVVTRAVIVGRRVVIPAGARAGGYVSESVPARRGGHARLQLALTSVSFDGRSHAVHGTSQEIVAGSPRARNLGGIAAGTVGGALLGRAIGGSGKGALVGGLIGGGAATAVVANSKGWQARIEPDRGFTVYAR